MREPKIPEEVVASLTFSLARWSRATKASGTDRFWAIVFGNLQHRQKNHLCFWSRRRLRCFTGVKASVRSTISSVWQVCRYLLSSIFVVSLNVFSTHTSVATTGVISWQRLCLATVQPWLSCKSKKKTQMQGAWYTCGGFWGLSIRRVHMLFFSLFMSIFLAVFA